MNVFDTIVIDIILGEGGRNNVANSDASVTNVAGGKNQ